MCRNLLVHRLDVVLLPRKQQLSRKSLQQNVDRSLMHRRLGLRQVSAAFLFLSI